MCRRKKTTLKLFFYFFCSKEKIHRNKQFCGSMLKLRTHTLSQKILTHFPTKKKTEKRTYIDINCQSGLLFH